MATAVLLLSEPTRFAEQNRAYLDVRDREGRLLTDEQVAQLPTFFPGPNPNRHDRYLQKEWRWRARTLQRFLHYLKKQFGRQPLRILDLGCGNGWMAMQLARRPDTTVWAVDVNLAELEQGARVAAQSGLKNVRFAFADILENPDLGGPFDLIVLAASVQYFEALPPLMEVLNRYRKPAGEIHVLDSPFYPTPGQQQRAREATRRYYADRGLPEMARWYHHHLWSDIMDLGAQNLNSNLKTVLLQRLRYLPPFPWVCLRDVPASRQ